MTKVFLLPTQNSRGNQRVINQITEAAKTSPLLVVFPKTSVIEPPEPPPMAA